MALTPEIRHRLYKRLEEVLGVDHAGVLMALLPPEGWGDVARRRDLAQLEERIDMRFAALDERLNTTEQRLARHLEERINAAITSQTRTMLVSMTVFMGSFAGLAFSLR